MRIPWSSGEGYTCLLSCNPEAVVIDPADPDQEILALHVFGTMRPEQVAEWQGPLPDHILAHLPGGTAC